MIAAGANPLQLAEVLDTLTRLGDLIPTTVARDLIASAEPESAVF